MKLVKASTNEYQAVYFLKAENKTEMKELEDLTMEISDKENTSLNLDMINFGIEKGDNGCFLPTYIQLGIRNIK